jgi:hypothetical protein
MCHMTPAVLQCAWAVLHSPGDLKDTNVCCLAILASDGVGHEETLRPLALANGGPLSEGLQGTLTHGVTAA